MAVDLVVQATLRGPYTDLKLEDETKGYELEKSTREEQAVTWRKQEVTNPWVGGSYVVTAVPENVTEKLAVWVTGATHLQLQDRIAELTRRVSQPAFYLDWSLGGVTDRWYCQYSDYSIRTSQEFLIATTALVSVSLSRLPQTVRL